MISLHVDLSGEIDKGVLVDCGISGFDTGSSVCGGNAAFHGGISEIRMILDHLYEYDDGISDPCYKMTKPVKHYDLIRLLMGHVESGASNKSIFANEILRVCKEALGQQKEPDQ